MLTQALTDVLNSHLTWTAFAVVCGIAGIGIGVLCGRLSMRQTAIDMLQLALERAARDIRLFRAARVGGIPNGVAFRLLVEAEYIVAWRALGANHLVKPSGESRMRPPGEPRSRSRKREDQRNQIKAFSVINPRSQEQDTGAVSRPARFNRRYEA